MAFLQICRRQQVIWKVTTVVAWRLFKARTLSVFCKKFCQRSSGLQNPAFIGKLKNCSLDPVLHNQPISHLSTQAYPLRQKVAQLVHDASPDKNIHSTKGHKKKKTSSAKGFKNKMDKKNTEVGEMLNKPVFKDVVKESDGKQAEADQTAKNIASGSYKKREPAQNLEAGEGLNKIVLKSAKKTPKQKHTEADQALIQTASKNVKKRQVVQHLEAGEGWNKSVSKSSKKEPEQKLPKTGQGLNKTAVKNDRKRQDAQNLEAGHSLNNTASKKAKKKSKWHNTGTGQALNKTTSKNTKKKEDGNIMETAKRTNKTKQDKRTGKTIENTDKKKQVLISKTSSNDFTLQGNVRSAMTNINEIQLIASSFKKPLNESIIETADLKELKISDSIPKNDVIKNEQEDIEKSRETRSLASFSLSSGIDEHSLVYCPDAVFAEAEDEINAVVEVEDGHLHDSKIELDVKNYFDRESNIANGDSDFCGGFVADESKTGKCEEESILLDGTVSSEQEQAAITVQTAKKYREGTAGGRLFKAQTLAEIDGYLYLGKPNEAQRLFNRYLRMGKKFEVDTFNKLLHGWAQKGNLMGVKLLYKLLRNEGLEPDMETYAALLHGYGSFGDADGVRNVLQEMEEKLLDAKHIFHKCHLTEPQAKGVLDALNLVNSYYQPEVPETPQNNSHPSLVASLYSDRYSNMKLGSMPGEIEEELNENMLQNLLEEQISRELSGIAMVKSVEEENLGNLEDHQKRKEMFLECRSMWRKALIKSIEQELIETKNPKGNSVHPRYAPFFQAFDPEELADITLDTIVFYVKGRVEGVPLSGVSGAVGSALNTKYIVKHRVQSGMLDKMKKIYHDYFSYLMDEKTMSRKMAREFWDELDDTLPYGASLQQDVPSWPWATKIVFGCALVDCFLKSATLNVNIFNNRPEKVLPAFYHTYEFKVNKKFGVLKPHPVVCKLFKGYLASQGEISMETTSVPMLVPPRPWRGTRDGAFLILPVELIRSADDEDGHYDKLLEQKTKNHDLLPVFDSLNFLGACAWKTNKRILDIAIRLFNSGGDEELAIPGPVLHTEEDSKPFKSTSPDERKKLVRERRVAKKIAREQYSLRMSALYKLSVANHFRDQVFWLPINLDFRGRVYPIPPHCTHVGDDLNRGMLQFAKGVPLGDKGLDWLKIHLVTLHGALKKASLQERLQYADKMMDEILDSADNPLTGRCWWRTADDPWQTLATCMEIADAVRSPDPSRFVSHQPVHQDGSCNGLQHYAALGRDRYGAKQVNLVPADRPQDVYEEVAKLVEAARLRDAEAGNEIAKELEGKVNRKVVKQTVMTIVYGVTFVGGRLQIERQLKDLEMDEKSVFKASTYLVTKVFASIGEMFTAARAIQNWFASSATQIALSGHYVDWHTPLGLYVSQPYSRKTPTKVLKTKLQWMLIKAKGLPRVPPDSRKQRGAFPPNFVHSLDSTHMMLTALFCQRSGATFSSVHDSFWTHAANVDVMNLICREQFVALHSEPILEELQKHFDKNYTNLKLARPLKSKESGEERTHASFEGLPKPGDFHIEEVLDSTYFFC